MVVAYDEHLHVAHRARRARGCRWSQPSDRGDHAVPRRHRSGDEIDVGARDLDRSNGGRDDLGFAAEALPGRVSIVPPPTGAARRRDVRASPRRRPRSRPLRRRASFCPCTCRTGCARRRCEGDGAARDRQRAMMLSAAQALSGHVRQCSTRRIVAREHAGERAHAGSIDRFTVSVSPETSARDEANASAHRMSPAVFSERSSRARSELVGDRPDPGRSCSSCRRSARRVPRRAREGLRRVAREGRLGEVALDRRLGERRGAV